MTATGIRTRAAVVRSLFALSRRPDLPHAYLNFVGLGGRFAEAGGEAAAALRLGLAVATNTGSPA